jgi:nitroreductase
MDIVETIKQRRSIRSFKPDPVPKTILQELMEVALRAPSWANTQPWDFAIVSGAKLEEIRRVYIRIWDEKSRTDLSRPQGFPEPYNSRRQALVRRDAVVMNRTREGQGEGWRQALSSRLYGAPCIIYIYTGRDFYLQGSSVNVWPIFDCGLIAENIMLLATNFGLGTLPAIQLVKYPDVLKKELEIPDSKLMVLGIAIGYPDWDYPLNKAYSQREPLDNITKWYGFE